MCLFLEKEDITICITASVISRRDDNHNQNLAIFYYGRVSVMTSIHNKPWNNLCLFFNDSIIREFIFWSTEIKYDKAKNNS